LIEVIWDQVERVLLFPYNYYLSGGAEVIFHTELSHSTYNTTRATFILASASVETVCQLQIILTTKKVKEQIRFLTWTLHFIFILITLNSNKFIIKTSF
jgi:hypothetical protein